MLYENHTANLLGLEDAIVKKVWTSTENRPLCSLYTLSSKTPLSRTATAAADWPRRRPGTSGLWLG